MEPDKNFPDDVSEWLPTKLSANDIDADDEPWPDEHPEFHPITEELEKLARYWCKQHLDAKYFEFLWEQSRWRQVARANERFARVARYLNRKVVKSIIESVRQEFASGVSAKSWRVFAAGSPEERAAFQAGVRAGVHQSLDAKAHKVGGLPDDRIEWFFESKYVHKHDDNDDGPWRDEHPEFHPITEELEALTRYWCKQYLDAAHFQFVHEQYKWHQISCPRWRFHRAARCLDVKLVGEIMKSVQVEFAKSIGPEDWRVFAVGSPEEREAYLAKVRPASDDDVPF